MAVLLALAVAGCGGGTEGTAIIANSPETIGIGPQRMLLLVADAEGVPLNDPEVSVEAEFFEAGDSKGAVAAEWIWAIEGIQGFYAAGFEFDNPGAWEVVLHPANRPPTPPTPFQVVTDVPVPEVGETAPAADSKTLPEVPLDQLTTDPDPDPGFYDLTVAEAVTSGRPSVVVFSTPAFCQTALCGPTLEVVKMVAPAYPDANFVHVEVFEIDRAREGDLVPVAAVSDWGLQTEPWVFVIDSGGVVTARFEGTIGATELERALQAVAG